MTSNLILPVGLGSQPDAVVHLHRETPPEWTARLREISPISETHSWLDLRWFAEAGRWVVYECVPASVIGDESLIHELKTANPDEPWTVVSRYQQEMFRQYHVHARPCWIIQGSGGGHHVFYDAATVEDHRRLQLPLQPPTAGDLPYAPFDERVVKNLIEMNKLVRFKNDYAEFKRRWGTVEGAKQQQAQALREARERYVKWINTHFEEPAEDFISAYNKGELADQPTTEDDYVEKNEISDQQYIERGRF